MSSLLHISARHVAGRAPTAELELSYDARQKSRFRATLTDGREVGVLLPRGQGLRDGDLLEAEDGTVVRIRARNEAVSRVQSSDLLLLSRAAYHLGNRHMAVQISSGELRYHHDYVIDEMLQQLGLQPTFAELPFEPESGAYGSGHAFASHPHYHSHDSHSHTDHSHNHSNSSDGHSHDLDHASAGHSHDHSHGEHTHDHEHPTRQHRYVLLPQHGPGTAAERADSPHRAGKIHKNWTDTDPSEPSR